MDRKKKGSIEIDRYLNREKGGNTQLDTYINTYIERKRDGQTDRQIDGYTE